MLTSFVSLDLETTGMDNNYDQIIEVGLVRVDQGILTAEYQTLVKTEHSLPVKIKRLTGITDAQLKNAPDLSEVLPNILEFMTDQPIIGHNISFDLGFLTTALGKPPENKTFDTLELARLVLPASPRHRLADLCQHLDIKLDGSHRALADAKATAQLALKLQEKMTCLDPGVLVYLKNILRGSGSPWLTILAALIKKKTITFSDLSLSPIPLAIKRIITPQQQLRPNSPPLQMLNPDLVASLFEPDGKLAAGTEYYEYRPQQAQMARQIALAFNDHKFLLLEAGTGTGKSMAYLVPALLWASQNNSRVIISTHTINLQEQLWHKDIPQLLSILDVPVKTALVKGRQNYLCLRHWESAVTGTDSLPVGEAAFLAAMLVWLTETGTGDRAELNLKPGDWEYWHRLSSDSDNCWGNLCPWHQTCYVNRARRNAEAAHLVVANHSLLLTDTRSENMILPPYGHLIIDEAHHLEEAATAHLGYEVSRQSAQRWLGSLTRLLRRLAEAAPPLEQGGWTASLYSARETQNTLHQQVIVFFERLTIAIHVPMDQTHHTSAVRLHTGPPDNRPDVTLAPDFANLIARSKDLLAALGNVRQWLGSFCAIDEAWQGKAADLTRELGAGETLFKDLEFIWSSQNENFVSWIQRELAPGGLATLTLKAAPIQVGEILHQSLFQNKECVLLTSATLTVNNSFDYYKQQSGLELLPPDQLLSLQIDSPFAYDDQCLLCVVNDLPGPGRSPEKTYLTATADTIHDLVLTSQGQCLVLFTSHHMLRETYKLLKPRLEEHDICLLGHNLDGSRSRLLEEFATTPRAVLMGASSFWEGVDLPGAALTNLIIVKLPFWPPQLPVTAARLESLSHQGKDGFISLSLPQAVIRFKQGFGRLIRSSKDQGVVVILDERVISKRYGRSFLNSLPVNNHYRGNLQQVKNKILSWLAKPGK